MDNVKALLGAALLLTLLVAIIMSITPGTKVYAYDKAMKACESDLPRSQRCIITAIPEDTP